MAKNTNFGTNEEKKFLNNMGNQAPENIHSPGRRILLWNYIANSNKRARWGDIDKHEVLEYANRLYINLG